MMVLLCAVVALQPSNHAHAQPPAGGDHHGPAGHDHAGKGPGETHQPADSPDACCHVAISGCSAVAFLPMPSVGIFVMGAPKATRWAAGTHHAAGRVTPPEDRPPRPSA